MHFCKDEAEALTALIPYLSHALCWLRVRLGIWK